MATLVKGQDHTRPKIDSEATLVFFYFFVLRQIKLKCSESALHAKVNDDWKSGS